MTLRRANLVGFFTCAGLLGFAFYAQYQLHLEPCPLCIFQRLGVLLMGLVFLVAALHGARRAGGGRPVYAVAVALAALATIAVAARQLYIQSLPPGSVPACGASLDVMLKFMPVSEVLSKVFKGSGECAKVDWRLLGLAMPAWVLIASAALGTFGVWANSRRDAAAVRF
ncbi:MAG: disulfide bond formation protein B [Steroidobacterales bacterium]